MDTTDTLSSEILGVFVETQPVFIFENHLGHISIGITHCDGIQQIRADSLRGLLLQFEWIVEITSPRIDEVEIDRFDWKEPTWKPVLKTFRQDVKVELNRLKILARTQTTLFLESGVQTRCMLYIQPEAMEFATSILLKANLSKP